VRRGDVLGWRGMTRGWRVGIYFGVRVVGVMMDNFAEYAGLFP
jgi:hypothetical protein